MKHSLRKAISLFSYYNRVYLIIGILLNKLRISKLLALKPLFQLCNQYVRIIESNVELVRFRRGILIANYSIQGKKFCFGIREFTSDINVFETVILQDEYEIAIKHFSQQKKQPSLIIDAGANVGFTTILFHAYFPNAKIAVIEPNGENLVQLQFNMNLNQIQQVEIFSNALWVHKDSLEMHNNFRDGKHWSVSVQPLSSVNLNSLDVVDGVTLEDVWERMGKQPIDLLKMDIEGAERFLFESENFCHVMQGIVKNIVIEIHDEYDVRPIIYQQMKKNGYFHLESINVDFFFKPEYSA